MSEVQGSFHIDMTPDEAEADGAIMRMSFEKRWSGGLSGSSRGVFLSAGDPESGSAGYVVAEVFHGSLGGRLGSFQFLQLGTMTGGETDLTYIVAPGSGNGELEGITGVLTLDVVDGEHHYRLTHNLAPQPEAEAQAPEEPAAD